MPTARKHQICLSSTPYYHCVSRCVRRSFLCGIDHYSGKSYEHRRSWVEQRILFLAGIFAIDVCAYAVMHNHTHLVLCIKRCEAVAWDDLEVLRRWHLLHNGTSLTRQFINPSTQQKMSAAEINTVRQTVNIYRQRLYDLSWFMRLLNENIARRANQEDECTGRFWEGRFKSQALLDEAALISCMAYVDLNPLRANLCSSIATARHTSVYKRINDGNRTSQCTLLRPFRHSSSSDCENSLPIAFDEYLTLLEQTTSCVGGSPPATTSTINALNRLRLSDLQWSGLTTDFEGLFTSAVGRTTSLEGYRQSTGRKRICGKSLAARMFGT